MPITLELDITVVSWQAAYEAQRIGAVVRSLPLNPKVPGSIPCQVKGGIFG